MKPINEIAALLGLGEGSLIPYGRYFCKVDPSKIRGTEARKGKLILVTSMSSTPAGEGKTTVTIGLTQALRALGKNATACIRQPSLGPFFGSKGGATGGGFSEVLPPDEISLHFTGDDHAVAASHNLISALLDNHIHHGNPLSVEPSRIIWPRVSVVSDRALRRARVSCGLPEERDGEFHISAASEIASILCTCRDLRDLKSRASEILLAFDRSGNPVKVKDLRAEGAATALLRKSIMPNLAQSTEGAPVFVHGGPFGNISLGCSSLAATRLALRLSDYVLTEAGFSTELGAEKFFDILCRLEGLKPSCAVVIATLRALRYHGSDDPRKGLDNLKKHLDNVRAFGVAPVVALNRFKEDSGSEINDTLRAVRNEGVEAHSVDIWGNGSGGGIEAAQAIIGACERNEADFHYLYDLSEPLEQKINKIATLMYGADGADFTGEAKRDIETIERLGASNLPVCIAKTPRSLSDNPQLAGVPKGFKVRVTGIRPALGAGYLVALCGSVLLMPGLPAHPLAESMDIGEDGEIVFKAR